MQSILLGLFNGLTYGMLLFLMASGLTLVFSMLGVLNFSHTAFYTLGAYFAYTASQLLGLGFWVGLVVSPACCALLGALIERFGIRHVLRYGLLGPLLLTFGIHIALIELVGLIWGKSPVAYAMPASLNVPLFSLYGIDYSAYRAFTLAMTLAVLALLVVTLKCTRIGTTVRASLSHPDIVNTLGHNLPLLRNMVFAAGAALAGLAGALSGNLLGTEPGMAGELDAILMIVIVVGGLGSLGGALVSSLLIGVLQTLATSTEAPWSSLLGPFHALFSWSGAATAALDQPISRFAPLVPFVIVVVVLGLRPRGLMGARH
ncbi:branched-chain amino acid ABC transporter permease [Paraburkholderia sp. BR13444]|uniref:branched-chain amino acid ABC transporter permease n=1 Tax=Paraburkholderia sp. BR13444 TaxID=3236997 RepID=UPI0034CFBC9C